MHWIELDLTSARANRSDPDAQSSSIPETPRTPASKSPSGVAASPEVDNYADLTVPADRRMFQSKAAGRNCVTGGG